MRKIISTLAIAFIGMTAFAQKDVTLCHTPSTEKFAMFASNKTFNSKHPNPIPFTYISQSGGRMITIKTDGIDANGYLIEAKTKTNNWIFVFQEWWGLNDYIKRESENLFNELGNVNVLALDMYDGKVGTTREEASKYMQEFKQERGSAIVKGALNFVGKNAKVGTIGWCFGGGQSIQAALTAGNQAMACVIYYGMPEENIDRLKTLNCDVLDIWPMQDKYINKDVMDKFEKNMAAAGKKLTLKPYDADHGFANPSNPKHSKEFTADAYKHTIEFFKARVK